MKNYAKSTGASRKAPDRFLPVEGWFWTLRFLALFTASIVSAAPVSLSWTDNAGNEAGFRIERAIGNGSFAEVATTSANATTFVDSTLASNQTYLYRVLAFNNAGASAYSNTAVVAVTSTAVNVAPTIGAISSQEIFSGDYINALPFVISDPETPTTSLMVSVSCSNPTLIPLTGISLGGSGGNRTLTLVPANGATGFADLTVTVDDGALTDSRDFRVTVRAVNQAPTISPISNRFMGVGASTGSISFAVGDDESAAGSLVVSAVSSNVTLVPANRIVVGGSGGNRSITVTPAAGRTGTATITVTVGDGERTTSTAFMVTVTTVMGLNQAPTISPISSLMVDRNVAVNPLTFSVSSMGVSPDQLTVTGASSNQALIPNANISTSGSGHTRTLSLVPVPGQAGTATITLSVSDGTTTTTQTFLFAVGELLPTPSRLLNVSTRVKSRPAQEALIPGFVINGTTNKRVLLRAIGPGMEQAPFHLTGVLRNPRLVLRRWDGTAFVDYASNDNWGSSANVAEIQQASAELSAFGLATDSLDAAMLVDLAPGRYTAMVDDPSGAEGVVIVELYDADLEGSGTSLINMSNRGHVGVGDEVMISGFVVSSDDPMTLLIRAVGPGLSAAPHNVNGMIANPMFQIYRSNSDGTDTLLETQDDWDAGGGAVEAAFVANQVSAFPLPAGSRDAAMVTTLQQGIYTVVVRGVDNARGSALVEIYAVD